MPKPRCRRSTISSSRRVSFDTFTITRLKASRRFRLRVACRRSQWTSIFSPPSSPLRAGEWARCRWRGGGSGFSSGAPASSEPPFRSTRDVDQDVLQIVSARPTDGDGAGRHVEVGTLWAALVIPKFTLSAGGGAGGGGRGG